MPTNAKKCQEVQKNAKKSKRFDYTKSVGSGSSFFKAPVHYVSAVVPTTKTISNHSGGPRSRHPETPIKVRWAFDPHTTPANICCQLASRLLIYQFLFFDNIIPNYSPKRGLIGRKIQQTFQVGFSWFVNICLEVFRAFNYSKIANFGSRTYSNTFWIISGTSKMFKSPPRTFLLSQQHFNKWKTNPQTFVNNIIFTYLNISTIPNFQNCWDCRT